MTGIAVSAIAIILAIVVFIILVYKGLSPILGILLGAIIVGFTVEGGPLTAVFDTFLNQAITFFSTIILLIVAGGFLSAVLEMTGVTDSLSNGIVKFLGEKAVPVIVFIMTGLLVFLGVGTYQFIVAPIALGLLKKAGLPRKIGLIAMMVAYNAITYCMPGTAVTPNLLPTTVLGTTIYAGAGVGIFAAILATALGLGYVYWMVRDAKKHGLVYEEDAAAGGSGSGMFAGMGTKEGLEEKKYPPFWNAIVTVILLFVLCFALSKVSVLDSTEAVALAQVIAAAWALITNWKMTEPGTRLKKMSSGTVAVLPLAVMLGFMSGFGAVVQSTSAFSALLSKILGANLNPYVLTFVGVAVLSACMANGTGAIGVVLNMIAPALTGDVNMGMVHRISTITASTLDSMPHCTNVCVSLQVFGLNHKQGYKDIFISTVIIPIIYAALSTLICVIFG